MHVLTLIHVIADVGPERPTGMSPIARRIPRDFDVAPHGEGGVEPQNCAFFHSTLPHFIILLSLRKPKINEE